ncbi:hypothetical protein BV898_14798 [Hypsibius exemplaris]|uniref:VWFC domain-containing protein n=1 Tax=Hypsibius exemplaris TaxID=2072580 RepID=A0A9X6NGL5_HYPEX|nr:hypothetical protein BV898_14798 [Hypsibius exemplaris]
MAFALVIAAVLVLSAVLSPSALALPFGNNIEPESASVRQIETGSACSATSGEILSEDPCRPWCVCKDGVVVCAEIFCSAENDIPDTCGKIKVNGRCCPTFVCIHNNGSASMHYPLPLTVVPPSMYEEKVSGELHTEKRSPIHALRRPKFL